jgi:uncharacterized protein YbaP (TraB family)
MWLLVLSACSSTLKKPFFYEIERDQRKSYVLGTIHAGFSADELPEFVHEKLKKSEGYASEVRTEWAELSSDQWLQAEIDSEYKRVKQNLQDKTLLSKKLSPSAWARTKELLLSSLKTEEQLQAFTPKLAYGGIIKQTGHSIIVSEAEARRLNYDRMDLELYQSAKKQQKVFIPLDRLKAIEDDCEDLIFVGEIESYFQSGVWDDNIAIEELFEMYRSGDENRVQSFAKKENSLQLEKCLLHERNKSWAETIDRVETAHYPLFVAVGVGHLVGESNLFEYLKKKGFTYRRVEF